MSSAIGSAANGQARGGGRTPGGGLPPRQRPTTGAARQAKAHAAEAAGSGRGAGQRARQERARAERAAQEELDAPEEQAEEEVRSVGEHDPWAQAAGIAPNSAPGNVGQTPPPQAAEARAATSAPGALDAGRGPHFDRFQIGTPERRRSGDEGFGGLSPVRGTGQDASGQQQQQQPWAQYQNTGWQGAAPVQPESWGPQGGQGAAVSLYGTGPPPPPPPYSGAYYPGSQQQPAALGSFLRSQAELNQHLAAAITRSGPPVTVLTGLDDSELRGCRTRRRRKGTSVRPEVQDQLGQAAVLRES